MYDHGSFVLALVRLLSYNGSNTQHVARQFISYVYSACYCVGHTRLLKNAKTMYFFVTVQPQGLKGSIHKTNNSHGRYALLRQVHGDFNCLIRPPP